MKCRICANECPPGAKVCRDCSAARKRAFAATVSQRLLAAVGVPSVSQPQFAPRLARVRTGRKPAAAMTARDVVQLATVARRGGAPRRLSLQWLWFSLAVAAVVVYLLVRMLAANYGEPITDAATPADTATEVGAVPSASSVFAATAAVEPAPPPAPSAAADAAARPAAEAAAPVAPAPKKLVAKTRARKAAAKTEVPAPAPPPAPMVASAPAPLAPAPQAAAVLPDPWQQMNDGLSRCSREDWIDRATCEQGLRLHYCASHWGLVPQCPIGPTDHGS